MLAFALDLSQARSSSADPVFTARYDSLIQRSVSRWWRDFPDWKDWKAQLYQESQLDPSATSGVSAEGIAQFMPATWADIERRLGVSGVSPRVARYAIDAGAYYMASLRTTWRGRSRPVLEEQKLAQASYNTGTGNVLSAQAACGNALLWDGIKPCLPSITGSDAQQTIGYVSSIAYWRSLMGE